MHIIRYIISDYVLPFSKYSFNFVSDFLCFAKTFYFNIVPFVYFFFCFPGLGRYIQYKELYEQHPRFCCLFLLWFLWIQFQCLTLWSILDLFVCGVKMWSRFISFACTCAIFPTPFMEWAIFSPFYVLASYHPLVMFQTL